MQNLGKEIKMGWLFPLIGLILGVILGLILKVDIPPVYVKYLSVALLAALDSVFGGLRANFEGNFNNKLFITGFFTNMLLAALITLLGDRLGVDLYLAAVVAFGVRIFQNLAIIRRHLFKTE